MGSHVSYSPNSRVWLSYLPIPFLLKKFVYAGFLYWLVSQKRCAVDAVGICFVHCNRLPPWYRVHFWLRPRHSRVHKSNALPFSPSHTSYRTHTCNTRAKCIFNLIISSIMGRPQYKLRTKHIYTNNTQNIYLYRAQRERNVSKQKKNIYQYCRANTI